MVRGLSGLLCLQRILPRLHALTQCSEEIPVTIELWALLGCGLVMLLSIIAQAIYLDSKAGLGYGLGNRDAPPTGLGDAGGRLDRNVRNQVEGLAMFIPLVVVAGLAGISNPWTQRAALVYVTTRLLYFVLYALGVKAVRSVVWGVGFFALLAFVFGILAQAGSPF